jgi:hypothetical protein
MRPKYLTAVIVCLIFLTLSVAYAAPIRIMPLGDSITEGDGGISMDDDSLIVGYRQKLYLDLLDAGYSDLNFVGSLSSGYSLPPAFDTDHEGHGGWCAEGCPAYRGDIVDHVYDWLVSNPAEVVLLHIGANDISRNIQDPTAVMRILDEIDRFNPDITVLLARIISRTDGKAAQVTSFNDAVEALAQARPEYGSTLFLVDMESALNYVDDMYDTLHPNLSGYHKMADVWLDTLYDILPPPTWSLTVQKAGAGEGRVTSNPEAIDCGSSCSDSFSYGTVVTLTATADQGSAFSDWDGCESANGNTCTITLNSDLTITASFRAITEVKLKLLSPNGGEIIPAGSPQYPITWEAPLGAVTFKFITTCSGQRISVNTFTGNNAMWNIPLFRKNKTGCFAKIKAYNAYGTKIDSDISDGTFMIEGVRITFPNQGNICTGGQICTITWMKSPYVPAASTHLSYTLNGITWHKIPAILPGDAESFDWTTPAVAKPKNKCKVKVVLRDSDGKKIGRDVTDGTFTIQTGS